MKVLLLTLALTTAFTASAPVSVVGIYLHPRASGGPLCLGDIADVEGDAEAAAAIETIAVDPSMSSDGYIDRGEVLALLESAPGPAYCVYGSAVRVERPNEAGKSAVVFSGDRVSVFVIKKGVRLRMKGVALQDAKSGDTVRVRTGANAVIEGRVMKNGTVEKTL